MEKRKVKTIALMLVISTFVQIIINLINPTISTATSSNTIDTLLGTITLKTDSSSIKAGDIVPVEVYVGGDNIISFMGYLNYDKNIFKPIDIQTEVEILENWAVLEGSTTELGTELFIYANLSEYACSNGLIATLYFTALKNVSKTDITMKYVSIGNKNYEDNMDENYSFPDITLTIESDIEIYNITYNANTTEVVNNMPEAETKEEGINYIISNKVPEREGYKFLRWNTKQDGTGTSYNANDIYNIDDNLTLYAQWKQNGDLYLLSEEYKIGNENINNYEEGDKYISRIEKETTKEEFIESLNTNGTIRILKHDGTELGENELIGTGMTIEVTKDEEKIELQIAVMGDLDGNGKITATDLSTLNQTILKTVTLENEYMIAADLDESEKITATDLSTLNKMLLKVL